MKTQVRLDYQTLEAIWFLSERLFSGEDLSTIRVNLSVRPLIGVLERPNGTLLSLNVVHYVASVDFLRLPTKAEFLFDLGQLVSQVVVMLEIAGYPGLDIERLFSEWSTAIKKTVYESKLGRPPFEWR